MSINKNLLKKNIELQSRIKKELISIEEGISKKNNIQLKEILNELQLVEKQSGVNLSYPRIIIDNWDYTDKLGLDLLSFAEMYKKNNWHC